MSKKLKRSAVALVLAATMVFSSQGVLTAFAVGENETSTAVDVSALEPKLDKEETVVVEEPGNTDETETPEVEVCEECQGVNGNHAETCPHYVDPNTPPENPTDDENNNNQEQQECTCGAEEGQPHEEGCPLYEEATIPECTCGAEEGQPHEEGCPLYEEPTVPECTCGAEEGQPHQEGCPLYEENTEETQEPSEEDVAAAKNVSDLIGALPEASTLDPETTDVEALTAQVKAAREAYDKLTDAQKALVEKAVLDKLVALEGALEALQNTNVADVNAVAKIGDATYGTLDEAIADAADGATIELSADCTTEGMNLSKSLTITAAEGLSEKPTVTFTDKGIALWGISLTFKDCNVVMKGIGSTPYTGEWNWMTICANADASLTLDKVEMTMDASGTTNSPHAIYFCNNNVLNIINGSNLTIKNYANDALEWDGGDGGYNVNITDSTFISDHNRSGFTGTFWVTAENSTVEVINSTGNGSNGSHYHFKNCKESDGNHIYFNNNVDHGLSAGNLKIENSDIVTNDNGMFGITYTGEMSMDGTSTIDCERNALEKSGGGIRANNAGNTSTVDAGAIVDIKDNGHNGLENYGDFTFEEGAIVTITGNDERTTNGGGIFNDGTLNLSSKTIIMNNHAFQTGGGICNAGTVTIPAGVQLYNNHAGDAGDDIYNRENAIITFTEVGSNWVLDDCNHTITGWFDDSKGSRWNVHTGPVHAELYDFDDATTTVSGALALKAAHPYQYDPDAPTEPSEPVDWETSKSKTATNLDKNYESQVTLSLPAAETVPVTDVVFVLDRSSSAGAARQEISDMMDNLLEIVNNSDAVINVGVVNFWYKADSGIELTALTSESIDSIKNAIMEGNLSGTNIEAGIDAAVAMLDASSTPDENKYMVLVTDGISHAWNDQNGEVKTIWGQGTADYSVVFNGANSYYYFDTTKTSFSTVFHTSSGDTQLNSDYEVPVFDGESVIEVLEDTEYADYYIHQGEYESYYSGVEKGVYEAAHAYANAASKYKCINLYWEVSGYPIASEFMEWTAEQGKCYNITGEENLADAFANVEKDITYVVDAGSQVVDVIGGDDDGVNYDYDFDFVDVVSLTVGGEELDFTKDGNTYYFGESRDGIYPFVLTYYPNGLGVETMSAEDEDVIAGELFVLEINVPITVENSVQLKYTVKLMNPKTAAGDYGQYDEDGSENYPGLYTNNSAVLYPVDSKGEIGEPESFPKPTVSYTVDNGNDNPGTDPTPDPDPDPDRPSRPNRDDDDDWEPLPDAPVKDKPTTEVDVPEGTETPTTEQPDKYNPETGDTTTVFAAMALAAVSLGGVVLLGRKKK